jgi:hypothetical protein
MPPVGLEFRLSRLPDRLKAELHDAPLQAPEIRQQLLRVRQGNLVGLFEPAEGAQIFHARGFEREHDFGEIEALDLRQFLRGAFIVFGTRPEAQTFARRSAPGPTGALIAAGLGNFFDEQRVDAAIRIVTGDARQAGINHEAHAVNRDARLGDVRGHDDFGLLVARDRGVLVARGKFAVQRQTR